MFRRGAGDEVQLYFEVLAGFVEGRVGCFGNDPGVELAFVEREGEM